MTGAQRLAVCVLAVLTAVPAARAAPAAQRFFLTPGPDGASCEIDVGMKGLVDSVWCVVEPPQVRPSQAVGVRLRVEATVRVCKGLRCVGNAPGGATRLAYGRSIRLGPFRCTSLKAGVRCLVARLGRGFQLSRAGVTRIG